MTQEYLENTVRPKLKRLLFHMAKNKRYTVYSVHFFTEDVRAWLRMIEDGDRDRKFWLDTLDIANAIWRQL